MGSNPEIEQMVGTFQSALEGRADYATSMVGLAQLVANKKEPILAFELCRKALAVGGCNPEVRVRARRLLSSLIPRYHLPMMNDARRNEAWIKVLGRAIHSNTRALEIGTGAGMLALMAARAGAANITTCERDPILAYIAQQIVNQNGFADRIVVVAKASTQLLPEVDVKEPADLLFCDIFGDNLFDFEPLSVLADARRRLTKPNAVVIPRAGAIRLALAAWSGYSVQSHIDHVAGFDFNAFADFAPAAIHVPVGDPGIKLKSGMVEAFRFDFSSVSVPLQESNELTIVVAEDGEVNGIIHWVSLELDADTALEARPEPGATYILTPCFWPLHETRSMRRNDRMRVRIAHDGKQLTIWPA